INFRSRRERTQIIQHPWFWWCRKAQNLAVLARVCKGADPILNDAFASRLECRGGRLQHRQMFVGSTEQPERPERTTDPDEQDTHSLKIDNPPAFPVE